MQDWKKKQMVAGKKKKNSRVKSLEPGEKKVLGMKEGAIKM